MRDVSCINWWFTDCTRTCLPWSIHFQHHATSQKTPCSLHSSPTLFYTSQPSKMSCDSVAYKVKDFHRMATLWQFSAKFCTLKRSPRQQKLFRIKKSIQERSPHQSMTHAIVLSESNCFVRFLTYLTYPPTPVWYFLAYLTFLTSYPWSLP